MNDWSTARAVRAASPVAALEENAALAEIQARLFAEPVRRPHLNRYQLLAKIGAGGCGVVYRARDPDLDRTVAIKLLHPRRVDAEELRRLVREARLLARLCHRNVVSVFDVGTDRADGHDAAPYIVMEMVDGVDLRSWLAQRPRSTAEMVRCFVAAGRGLAAAHRQGIVHRDFKPANVLVGQDGSVKVVDFGLARGDGERSGGSKTPNGLPTPCPSTESCQTRSGTVMGTPAYMAPEQHRGHAVDARADQYSFCASLAEALYGTRLFRGADLEGLYEDKTRNEHRMPPRAVAIPRPVSAALNRGLDPDPERRFPSMDALLDALAPAEDSRSRWRRPLPMFAAALTVAVGFVVTAAQADAGVVADRSASPVALAAATGGPLDDDPVAGSALAEAYNCLGRVADLQADAHFEAALAEVKRAQALADQT
ncbi:MAG: serine/threonine-protein kinase, partial [Myxococcota bacterium]